MKLLVKSSVQSVPSAKLVYKGYNKHFPDPTISKCGIEYDMSLAPIKAYYYSERLAERNNKHESLDQYENDLDKVTSYMPHRELNPRLEHARSQKVQRHRDFLPGLLF
jgi:hypothetical protein